MPFKIRQKQDRPKKERKEPTVGDLNKALKENDKLKKEVSRLRKQLNKTVEPEPIEEFYVPMVSLPVCESCGNAQTNELVLNNKTYIVCKECKWRKLKT